MAEGRMESPIQKEETCDIAIVGGGASGLAAAVTAASSNCHVLVFEKCSALGGSTALAIGSVTAAGTKLQGRAGIRDSPEDLLKDTDNAIGDLIARDNRELKKVLVQEAGDTVDWLTNLGASFVGPFGEPMHRFPRMHNIVPNSRSYISVLRQAATRNGVEIRLGSQVLDLITSEGGVTGVRINSLSGPRTIKVNKAVILATGDYSSNKELRAQFMSKEWAKIDGLNPSCTGDGHVIAMGIGAAVRNMDLCNGPNLRFLSPSRPIWVESLPTFPVFARLMGVVARHAPKYFFRLIAKRFLTVHTAPSIDIFRKGAILINKNGRRFTNELQNTSPGIAVAGQPGSIAYIFFDSALARKFSKPPNYISTAPGIAYAYFGDYRTLRKDIIVIGQTVAQLSEKISMDPITLIETVDRYNHFVMVGKDDDFGREDLGQGLHEAPFYILGPLKVYIPVVDGGLVVDCKCRVLNDEGKIISGLYAAGSVGQGGLILPGHGLHIAWALVSGRIAGRNAKME
jgi:fumarate reductase flavoprotein subunit